MDASQIWRRTSIQQSARQPWRRSTLASPCSMPLRKRSTPLLQPQCRRRDMPLLQPQRLRHEMPLLPPQHRRRDMPWAIALGKRCRHAGRCILTALCDVFCSSGAPFVERPLCFAMSFLVPP